MVCEFIETKPPGHRPIGFQSLNQLGDRSRMFWESANQISDFEPTPTHHSTRAVFSSFVSMTAFRNETEILGNE